MKELKPFNLQEALAGKPVMLRDGRKAYVRHHETELKVAKSVCLQGFREDGNHLSWCENGNYHNENKPSFGDIVGMYPETRTINGFKVPVPETQAPEHDTDIYVSAPGFEQFYINTYWEDSHFDRIRLARGLIFLNKEVAIANAKAMLGIDPHSKAES